MKIEHIDINYEFGKRIKYLRKLKKISQEELAFRCNLNKNYLGDVERGKRNPTLMVIEKIASGLDISLAELFLGM
ncbi:MAG: helix-turn-helix transcriptional regulator [Candidatus Onthovivens sp.]|nr:helix-turn-helix transcriptional regulator [Candidatus Onthovivens sp.]